MVQRGTPLRALLVLVILSIALGLCSLPAGAASKEDFLQKGEAYFAKGQFREAELEFRNALQKDSQYAKAHYQLALTYLKMGRLADAYRMFFNVVTLNPNNVDAQVRMGQIALLARRTEEAKERAENVLKLEPKNVDALVLLSQANSQHQDTRRAIENLDKAQALAPERADIRVLLGQEYENQANFDRAEKEFAKASELAPKLLTPRLLLVKLLLGQGKTGRAAEVLRETARLHPDEARLQLMLVELLVSQQKAGQAEKTLTDLIKTHPDEERYYLALARIYGNELKPDLAAQTYDTAVKKFPQSIWPALMAARFYASLGQRDKAQSFLDLAAKIQPDSPVPQNALAELALEQGDLARASSILKEVRQKNPGDTASRILEARVLWAKGKIEEAVALLTDVLRERPDHPEALYRRAQAFLRQNKPKLSKTDLVKAVAADITDVRARLLLATLQARSGETLQAMDQVNQILRLDPRNLPALDLRGRLYLGRNHYAKAEQDFQKIIKLAPKLPIGYLRLGMLAQARKQSKKAIGYYTKSLKINPGSLDALMRLAFVYLGDNQPQKALEAVQAHIDKAPRKDQVHTLMGDLYQSAGDFKNAGKQYKLALKANPKMLGPIMGLAAISKMGGDLKLSRKYLDQAVEIAPNDATVWVARGDINEALGLEEDAIKDYRRALLLAQDFIPALNNLAYLLARRGGDRNLNEALPLIQRAKRQAPGDPRINDTLGWVLHLRGANNSALTEFKDAVRSDPDNPTFRYHLAVVQWKLGQADDARKNLEKALKSGVEFSDKKAAGQLLKKIGQGKG